jgi:hypothetical protein
LKTSYTMMQQTPVSLRLRQNVNPLGVMFL